MFRVMRKETLHKYISMGQKSNLKILISVTSIDQKVSRRCRALNFNRYSYRGGVKQVSSRQKLSRSIHQLSRSYRDCDKKKLKISIDSLAVERCRDAVKLSVRRCLAICPALLNSFSSVVSWSNLHGFNTRLEQHIS